MDLARILASYFNAISAEKVEVVQQLWSNYGEIVRYRLNYQNQSNKPNTVIVKWISPPTESSHPRGWDSDLGHLRKLSSYQIEANWYQDWASKSTLYPAMPRCYHVFGHEALSDSFDNNELSSLNKSIPALALDSDTRVIVMADLDTNGYFVRPDSINPEQAKSCLKWLAQFHAVNVRDAQLSNDSSVNSDWPQGLWPIGCYWHLGTREQEFNRMIDGPLKQAAQCLDTKLNNCRYTSIVHGDAKLANFCFNLDGSEVAAVDFQYIGAGCGVRDLAYFLGSAFNSQQLDVHYDALVDYYFEQLSLTLQKRYTQDIDFQQAFPLSQLTAIETEWRTLLPIAWADFQRFLVGWAPEHWKNNAFAQTMTEKALENLSG